jgi:lysophospholipase L1-like esterase
MVRSQRKSRKRLKIVIAIIACVVLLLGGAFLWLLGVNFVGPFRILAVNKITDTYKAEERQGEIVFYGASNFARWTEMENDLSGYKVQNHGFGGSADKDLYEYAPKLLYPYKPSVVFVQTGSNDYVQADGTDSEKITASMAFKREMFSEFHQNLPDARFIIMSGLLLPGRTQYLDMTIEINRQLKQFCEENASYMTFVDASAMTYDGGAFAEELFVGDGIHLNREGQQKWAKEYIIPVIEENEVT